LARRGEGKKRRGSRASILISTGKEGEKGKRGGRKKKKKISFFLPRKRRQKRKKGKRKKKGESELAFRFGVGRSVRGGGEKGGGGEGEKTRFQEKGR